MDYEERARLQRMAHEYAVERQDRTAERQEQRRQIQDHDRVRAAQLQGDNALEVRRFDASFLPRKNELDIELERALAEIRVEERLATALHEELLAEIAFDRTLTKTFLEVAGTLLQQRGALQDAHAARVQEQDLAVFRQGAERQERDAQRRHECDLAALAEARAHQDHIRAMQAAQQAHEHGATRAVLDGMVAYASQRQQHRQERDMAVLNNEVGKDAYTHQKVLDFAIWLEMRKRDSEIFSERIKALWEEFEAEFNGK